MKSFRLPEEITSRRAIVYVRQSTGSQVVENLESQRLQYEMANHARGAGFKDVVVIDSDPWDFCQWHDGSARLSQLGRTSLRRKRWCGVLLRRFPNSA